MVHRVTLAILTYSAITCLTTSVHPESHNSIQRSAPPSDRALLDGFKAAFLLRQTVTISEDELNKDLQVIGSSLAPLLAFSWERPGLQEALMSCMSVILSRSSSIPGDSAQIKKLHDEALTLCLQEYGFFCRTTDEYDRVARCIKNLGLYYAPTSTLIAIEEAQTKEASNKKYMIVGGSLLGAAVILIGVGLRRANQD